MKYSKCLLLLFCLYVSALTYTPAHAQEISLRFAEQPHERVLVVQEILNRLTVWHTTTGAPIYHQNCRNLYHGCERQIAAYVELIYTIAEEQDINPLLLIAVAWHESRFNAFAESSAGAVGIFQLLRRSRWSNGIPFIHNRHFRQQCRNELGSCQLRSIRRAAYWITESINHCGSVRNGLRMYNSGRCDGPRRYPSAIFAIMREIQNNITQLRANISLYTNNILCYSQQSFITNRYINNIYFGLTQQTNMTCVMSYSYYMTLNNEA